MSVITAKLLYNPNGTDDNRRMIKGDSTNLLNLYDIKYQWAYKIWETMLQNHWIPEKSPMNQDKESFKKLTEDEQDAYLKILSFLIFLDSIQTNNVPNITQYITAPEVTLPLGRQTFDECLVPDTEVLTIDGWKAITDITLDDKILECDEHLNSTFSNPTKLHHYNYVGNIHHFKGNTFSQMVTDEHRMLIHSRYNKTPIVKKAKEFREGKLDNSFFLNTFKEGIKTELTTYEKFLIALQADGTIYREIITKDVDGNDVIKYKNRNGKYGFITVSFSFSKQRKIDKLLGIVNELDFEYNISKDIQSNYENVKAKTVINIKIPTSYIISKNFSDWVDLDSISSNWGSEFLNELKQWDGWEYNKTSFGYDTTDSSNATIAQQIAVLSGTYCSLNISTDARGYKDVYHLVFIPGKNKFGRGTISKTSEPYNGDVYCVSVPRGFFVIRHKGFISVTGNCLHSRSYGHILTSIFNKEKATKAIYYWRDNEVLAKRNEYIAKIYQDFNDNPTDDGLIQVIIANYLLEGLYFYNGFQFFYNLESRHLMPNTAVQIRYINRDEIQHCNLFKNIIKTIKVEEPELWDRNEAIVYDMFKVAVEQEIEFSNDAIGDKILGINKQSIYEFTHFMANRRLREIGLDQIFEKFKNPYEHLEKIGGVENESSQKENFFETQSIKYKQATILDGWDLL